MNSSAMRVGFLRGVGAKLAQQKAAAFGQQQHVVDRQMLAEHVVDHQAIEAFQADRLVLEHCGHVIGGDEGIGKAEHHQAAMLRAMFERAAGLEHGDAGALGAHQGAGYVKAVFRQQLVQVVAGDAAGNFGKALADQVAVGIPDAGQAGIDLAPAAAAGDDGLQFGFRGSADGEPGAVVEKDVERFDIVDRLAAHERVYATGVVTDHASQRAPAMGGRIGGEGKIVFFGGIAQPVEHDAGLDAGEFLCRIELQNRVHVFGEVHDHGHIAALAGQAGAASARENGRAQLAACGHGGHHVSLIQRQNQADGHLAVVGSVGGVESARSLVEADLAAHHLAQFRFQLARSGKAFVSVRCAGRLLQDRKRGWGGHGQERCYQDGPA